MAAPRSRSSRATRQLPHELAGFRHARPDELTKGSRVYAWAAQPQYATPGTVLQGPKDLVTGGGISTTPHYLVRYDGRSSTDAGWIPRFALYVRA